LLQSVLHFNPSPRGQVAAVFRAVRLSESRFLRFQTSKPLLFNTFHDQLLEK